MNAVSSWMGAPSSLKPVFAGKSKYEERKDKNPERFSEASAALEKKLLDTQADGEKIREYMRDEWNIILWSLRDRGEEIRLRIQRLGDFDEKAFKEWFYGVIGRRPKLDIRYQDADQCCYKPCDGCLMGNKSRRKTWIG